MEEMVGVFKVVLPTEETAAMVMKVTDFAALMAALEV